MINKPDTNCISYQFNFHNYKSRKIQSIKYPNIENLFAIQEKHRFKSVE